jgi:hypothetical protein
MTFERYKQALSRVTPLFLVLVAMASVSRPRPAAAFDFAFPFGPNGGGTPPKEVRDQLWEFVKRLHGYDLRQAHSSLSNFLSQAAQGHFTFANAGPSSIVVKALDAHQGCVPGLVEIAVAA